MASSLGLAIFMKLIIRDIDEKAIVIGVSVSVLICLLWFFINYSKYIVESFPAVIIGGILIFFLNKIFAYNKSIKRDC